MQEQSKAGGRFQTKCNADRSSSDSRSDSVASPVPSSVRIELVASSLAYLDTNAAVLAKAPDRYFRIYECISIELALASDEKLHSGPVLNAAAQPLLKDLSHSFFAKKDAKHSAYA